ncbi:MAG: tRNA uridine-5-carboxymethylaminomethyl(34) synthesis GTPase MnmE [Mariprofundaceae bacterium]
MRRETIAAIATAPGRAGIGVIRLSGPESLRMVQRLIGEDGTAGFRPRFAHLRRFFDAQGRIIDSGLVLWFPGPRSYTGEDVVELQVHGSPVTLRMLLSRLFDLGARPAEPGEFTRRAIENGRMDLTQAEAVIACIDAATERAARLAQRHLTGDFGRRVEGLMDAMTRLVARLEASLDFPEDDLPPLYFEDLAAQAKQDVLFPIVALLDTAPLGERLIHGARVAIIGAPNVGKSSLLNRLAGGERAIVSDIPGTTRDVVEADFEVHGIPVRLVDTAGMRESEDAIEREGVRRARRAAREADLTVFVADAERPDTWQADADVARIDLKVMNKVDLVGDPAPDGFLPVSARTGKGMAELCRVMAERLGDIDVGGEDMLVCSRRHATALEDAKREIEAGLALLGDEGALDLVGAHWRRAWSSLGEILGIGDVEHILDRVFADFCIGK